MLNILALVLAAVALADVRAAVARKDVPTLKAMGPEAMTHLARIYEDLGDLEKARATWRSGLEVVRARRSEHPDDKLLWINLLIHAVVHDDPDGDIPKLLPDAHARWPGNPAVEFGTAVHDLSTGNPAEAAHRIERLLALDLDEIVATGSAFDARMFGEWAWNALGLARFDLGDFAGAAEMFRRAEAADPENVAYRTRRMLAEARSRAR